MKITGQLLKENRERKGISINEVAIATKINNKTLISMEEGDLANLPPKTFLRGFVRAYATYLELDVESVLNTFYDEMGSTNPKAPAASATVEAPLEKPKPARARPSGSEANDAINPKTSTAFKAAAVAGILLLVFLIVFFKNKMESYEKETVVEGVPAGLSTVSKDGSVPPPADSVALSGSPTPSESPTPPSSTEPVAGVAAAASASPAPTASPTPAPTEAPSATPKNTPKPTPEPTPEPTAAPTATPEPTPKPTATPKEKAGKPQEVIIEALNDVDIDAQIDGEAKKVHLNGDQVQSFKAKRRIVLRFSDGGAVNLIVNGTEKGVPGDLGKPLKIELP